ncbi:MAG: hypothetical protein PF508_12965 [Spirochaeta sp.]|jgi:hypothetical protein|nr:hypothetical protein [Spirochaeta sp.]
MDRKVILGILLLGCGAALLLITTGVLTIGALILPFLLFGGGVLLFWRAFLPDGRDSNAFTGTLLSLTGGFWLLWESALPLVPATSVWPVFMTIVGVALVVYGIRKGGAYRFTLVTPGVAIVLLSGVFLLFSLKIVETSLVRMATVWWPLILVGVGLMVLVRALVPNTGGGDETDVEDDLMPRELQRGRDRDDR